MNSTSLIHPAVHALRLTCVAALLAGALLIPHIANAHGGDTTGDGLFFAEDCGNHIGSEPWTMSATARLSPMAPIRFNTPSGWWAYAAPGANGTDCADFAYLRVQVPSGPAQSFTISPHWDRNQPAEFCTHSAISYAVFKRTGASAWQLAGSGLLFGNAADQALIYNRDCSYQIDQPGLDKGQRSVSVASLSGGEIAVIAYFWGHNHADPAATDCNYGSCFYPGIVIAWRTLSQATSLGASAQADGAPAEFPVTSTEEAVVLDAGLAAGVVDAVTIDPGAMDADAADVGAIIAIDAAEK